MEAFVTFHEKKLIYRANRLVNWCVKMNTTLSGLEVSQDVGPGSASTTFKNS